MRTWRIEIDRKHFLNSMYKWEKSSFTELVSAFRGTAETIRGDFAGDKRKEFEALIATVTSYDANNFNNEQEHQKLLKAIDEIIAIVEVARP